MPKSYQVTIRLQNKIFCQICAEDLMGAAVKAREWFVSKYGQGADKLITLYRAHDEDNASCVIEICQEEEAPDAD